MSIYLSADKVVELVQVRVPVDGDYLKVHEELVVYLDEALTPPAATISTSDDAINQLETVIEGLAVIDTVDGDLEGPLTEAVGVYLAEGLDNFMQRASVGSPGRDAAITYVRRELEQLIATIAVMAA